MLVTLSRSKRLRSSLRNLALSAERLERTEDESRKSKAAYIVTAVALCVCVCWSSLMFSRVGKENSDSENHCLSVMSVIACHSDKACSARMCGVGRTRSLLDRRWSLERGDLKSAAKAIFA